MAASTLQFTVLDRFKMCQILFPSLSLFFFSFHSYITEFVHLFLSKFELVHPPLSFSVTAFYVLTQYKINKADTPSLTCCDLVRLQEKVQSTGDKPHLRTRV